MPDPQGLCTFDGIARVVSATFSLTHGISPNAAMLDIAPQANLLILNGTLRFIYGNTLIAFGGCRIDAHSMERTESGEVFRVRIYDRRWRWAFGAISGEYNRHQDDDVLLLIGGKSPQQLAKLCLDALGETNYDVSELPDTARPYVHWDEVRPAEALARLCDQFGCRVVLGVDDRVYVRQVGVGQPLDRTDGRTVSEGIDAPELPDKIVIRTAPVRVQMDFELEAVGLDTDGSIKPLGELSYASKILDANREALIDLDHHTGLAQDKTSQGTADLARQSVARWYRVIMPVKSVLFGDIENRHRVVLEDEQVEVVYDLATNQYRRLPAMIYGRWCAYRVEAANRDDSGNRIGKDPQGTTTQAGYFSKAQDLTDAERKAVVPIPFTIDREVRFRSSYGGVPGRDRYAAHGLVRFSHPVTGIADGKTYAAQLWLRTACTILEYGKRSPARQSRNRQLTQNFDANASELVVVRNDITPEYVETRSSQEPQAIVFNNDDFVTRQANYYLDQIERTLTPVAGLTVQYAGIKRVQLDGAIRQVTWSLGVNQPSLTVASRNDEQLDVAPSFAERRQQERLQSVIQGQAVAAGAAP